MHRPFLVVVLVAAFLPALLTDCTREPTPEQKQADSTLAIAKAQLDAGDYQEGKASLTIAVALDLRLNRPEPLAEEYTLLGRISVLSADFDGGIISLTKAIEQYKSLTDHTNARKVTLEIASLHRQMGEEQFAYNMYTEALRLANVFHDAEGAQEIQLAMLPACRATGREEEEAQTTDALLKAYEASGNQRMQARVHFEHALSLIHRQGYAQAVEILLRALTFADHAKDSLFVINILSTLADAYFRSGNTKLAFETYTDALLRSDRTAGAQEIRIETLTSVGNTYLGLSQFSDAARFYRAALSAATALKNKLAEGYLFTLLGHCAIGNRQVKEAMASMQNAIDLFSSEGYDTGLAFADASMGLVRQEGHPNEAVADLKAAVELAERFPARPTTVYAAGVDVALHQQSYCDVLNELLLRQGRTDEAFWYAERAAELALSRKLSALELRARNETVNTLLAQFRHAQAVRLGADRQMASLLTQGPDDKAIRDQVLSQIRKSLETQEEAVEAIIKLQPDILPALRYNGTSLADVQRRLTPGTVLLRHVATGRAVYAFAVTNTQVNLQLAAVDRNKLRSDMSGFTSLLRQLDLLADSPAVQRKPIELQLQERSAGLYSALLRPVAATLANASSVLILPDAEYPFIPFHALRKSGGRSPFAIEQFSIAYLPSLALLGRPALQQGPVRDVVALGQPGTTGWDVEYELRDIRAFYKDARLYFGQQATLATLRREHGDILHLALDLRYSSLSPGNASVVLSDEKMKDIEKEKSWGEFLSLSPFPTVIVSDLRADSTGIDALLPTLFMMDGSSTVIINTLPVSRKAKKYFGELFYTGLLAGKTPESACRDAQRQMINEKDYAAPPLWAPFSLWKE